MVLQSDCEQTDINGGATGSATCAPAPAWAADLPASLDLATIADAKEVNGVKRLVIEIPSDAAQESPADPNCPLNLIARALAFAQDEGCFLLSGSEDVRSHMIEPLTEREEDVLRLVASGMSNGEIAERLFLSIGTVKTHLHNAFGKLAVGTRTKAIVRAKELSLI